MVRGFDYGGMMHRALQRLIADVLSDVAAEGLPGDHHFFITFDTRDPDVEMADWLRERYPEEMTIVIQHWFDNLEVTQDGFSITLNFGNSPETLYIPFDALHTFVDPSAEFGLRFETQSDPDEADDDEDEDEDEGDPAEDDGVEEAPKAGAEVVSLDKWRK
ncbi:MAG: ClpXP protease specificity-enhancing factor SspB [Paracoccus sp. (in: a-proteobacteria)]|uniref:SspB family protein n=1 Tax=Paracoccus sp. TaxID=267 RepID=UPI0039E2545D